MSGHAAVAVRPSPPQRGFWRVDCPDGCTLPKAASREHAEWEATKHRIRAIARSMPCLCDYDPEWMEYGPHYEPCRRCAINDALGEAS